MAAYLTHITKQGERWDQIAYQYYGDAYAYERIIAANPNVAILDALPGGVTLAIPIITVEDTDTEQDLPPWLRSN